MISGISREYVRRDRTWLGQYYCDSVFRRELRSCLDECQHRSQREVMGVKRVGRDLFKMLIV